MYFRSRSNWVAGVASGRYVEVSGVSSSAPRRWQAENDIKKSMLARAKGMSRGEKVFIRVSELTPPNGRRGVASPVNLKDESGRARRGLTAWCWAKPPSV